MGNSSTASSPSSSISRGNESLAGGHSGFWSLWSLMTYTDSYMEMVNQCQVKAGDVSWLVVKVFFLVTAFPANMGLMWLLLRRKSVMSASEVLGLNVSVMDVLYCLCLPLDIYSRLVETSRRTQFVREALFALNIFGCPLLLTCMCVERYVAAARPVSYLRMGQWENRAVLCTAAWLLTITVALMKYFLLMFVMALSLSVTISLLFLIMLLCLLGLVWLLRQSGPGRGSPLKKRALKNVVAVMVPAVVAYSPLVALVPYISLIVSKDPDRVCPEQCRVLMVLLLFPNLGLFIGSMFYLTRFRRLTCCTKDQQTKSTTQAE